MPNEQSQGKPNGRRDSVEEKGTAVGVVRTLRAELGTDHGTVQRSPASWATASIGAVAGAPSRHR